MKKVAFLSLFTILTLATQVAAQASYSLKAFDEVNVSGNIELVLEESMTEKLTFTTEGISEDKLNITNKNGILKIKISNGIYKKNQKAYVSISYKTLRSIKSFAGAQVSATKSVIGDKLEIKAHSGSSIDLEIEVNAIDAGTYEGGVINLSGLASAQRATSNTGGEYNARRLVSDRVYVKASTGGDAVVQVTEVLEAKASLGGTIRYFGNPEELSQSTSLGGTIERAGGSYEK